jgi:flagellar biosynthetic protein FlhB
MSEDDQSGEKEFEPTEQKLKQQREKGEVPRSTDLNTAAAFLGLLIGALAIGHYAIIRLGDAGLVLLTQADRYSALIRDNATPVIGALIGHVASAVLPILIVPFLLVWAGLFAQRTVIFAPKKLKPKLSRINPISNAKNKFGRNGLFEFAKSTVKLLVISAVLWQFLLHNLPLILTSMHLTPALASAELMLLVIRFLALVFVVKLSIGAIDFFWQRAEHLRRNRMSHKEMRDEHPDEHASDTRPGQCNFWRLFLWSSCPSAQSTFSGSEPSICAATGCHIKRCATNTNNPRATLMPRESARAAGVKSPAIECSMRFPRPAWLS